MLGNQDMSFGQSAAGVDDLAKLSRLFAGHIRRFGLAGFGYTLLNGTSRPDPVRTVAALPDGWVEHYFENNFGEHDPILAAARRTNRPFQWSRSHGWIGDAPRFRTMLNEAAAFGLHDGITFSIPGLRGCDAVAAVICGEPGGRALNPVFDEHLQDLHVAVLELHLMIRAQLDRRPSMAAQCRLTGRERECFQWIASGKSAWEIGRILGISERTVVFHIDNVKRKLNVGSRMQALVKLVRAGEIEPSP